MDNGTASTSTLSSGRPTVVTVVVALAVLAGGYLIVDGMLTLFDADRDNRGKIVDGVIPLAQGLLALAVAVGALRMRAWAWELFMTLAVLGLTVQLLRHFSFGDPAYARLALNAFIVFALTPRDVQVAFGVRPPANVDLTRPTRNPLDSH